MSKKTIPESKLIKAIAELEAVAKGDALEDADPEGGLSTEGEPLSTAAPRGRGEQARKSRRSSDSESPVSKASSSGSDDSESDDDGDDSESGDDASSVSEMMSAKPKVEKSAKTKAKVSKAASRSSSSSDAGSDDDDEAEKSFREMAEGDETMRKGIVVNDFLEAMVDQISLALYNLGESVSKSIAEVEQRLSARIDDQVAKSAGVQQAFNARLAKAVSAIGNTVQGDILGMADAIKSLANQPVSSGRGRAVLSKGEVNQPPWSSPANGGDPGMASGSGGDYVEELKELSRDAIGDWLFKKLQTNQVDSRVIMAWEADRYQIEALPLQVRKALVNELCK